jgi:hypothetical protein
MSPRVHAILLLTASVGLGLAVGRWGPIPDYWRGLLTGSGCTYLLMRVLEERKWNHKNKREASEKRHDPA